jgi:hypothetical protein
MVHPNTKKYANTIASLCGLGWAVFGFFALKNTEARLLEVVVIGAILVTSAWLLSHLAARILAQSTGALRLGIAVSIAWITLVGTFFWKPFSKYPQFGDFIILSLPIFIFWSAIWVIKGFLKDSQSQDPNNEINDVPLSSALDEFIKATYGDPPPRKTAQLSKAVESAYKELLMEQVPFQKVQKIGKELMASAIPYSTEDLAISISLTFFSSPEFTTKLEEAQMMARLKLMEWISSGKVNHHLAKTFEEKLYQQFKS